ncbi:MAG: hypothetical protein M4579_007429 [Chaenotheca gracillima]|nr:MAG: hypothetical protein M4579_007429 [Chaenotheca gracillima]
MPTYALLGATGATGSAILRCLLAEPPSQLKLNILVRSKSKLLSSFPELQKSSPFPIDVFEGPITDKTTLQSCLQDVDVIFMCIATNFSAPDTSIALDSAIAVVESLESLRQTQGSTYKTPMILQLRSVSLNKNINGGVGGSVIYFCLYYVYSDLERACELYEAKAKAAPGLFEYISVDPPDLHDPNGTERTGHKLLTPEQQKTGAYPTSLSYSDLGGAFCEVARRTEEFAGESAMVTGTGKVNLTWGTLLGYIFQGLKSRVFG